MIIFHIFLLLVFYSSTAAGQYSFDEWHQGLETPISHPDLEKWQDTIPFGDFKGQQVNQEKFKHVGPLNEGQKQTLTQEMKKLGMKTDTDYFAVDQVNHDGEWYTAAIPKKAMKLYFLTEYFGPKIPYFMPDGIFAHAALNFGFPDDYPALLVPKSSKNKPLLVHDLVMSADGARPKGVKFNAIKGIFNTYLLVTNFKTGITMARNQSREILAYELEIEPNEVTSKLKSALQLSLNDGYGHRYHTLAKRDGGNCHTTALCIVDEAGEKQQLEPVVRTFFGKVKKLPTYIYRGVMNTRKWIAENIPGARLVRPAEFYPALTSRALKCRNVFDKVQNLSTLKHINNAL